MREQRPELLLNIDQANFRYYVETAMTRLCRTSGDVKLLGLRGPGYSYSDYVVSIYCTRGRKDCDVYRNRTGTLLLSMRDGKVTLIDREYTFVTNHLKSKLGIADG